MSNFDKTLIMEKEIYFDSYEKGKWIKTIAQEQANIINGYYRSSIVTIRLTPDLKVPNLNSVHIVTLACLVLSLKQNGCIRGGICADMEIIKYLTEDLHLSEYFSHAVPHVRSENNYNLNLWKVSSQHALMYSQHVSDYIKRNYFSNKDLSGLKVVLDELYANIADHSESKGLAYSFIKYDPYEEMIRIAFCDFGIGIKASLLKGGANVFKEFIYAATRKGVSARSNTHNKGFGLDTVVSSINDSKTPIRILSGRELFVSFGNNSNQRTWDLDFDFKGTLIYFDMPFSAFEDADDLENFEL